MAVIFTNTIIKIKSRVVRPISGVKGIVFYGVRCIIIISLHDCHVVVYTESSVHTFPRDFIILHHWISFKPHASINVFDETTDSGCPDPTRGPWITWTVRSCLHITLSFYRGVSTGLQTSWSHFLCRFWNLVSYVIAILLYHMVTT